MFTSLIAQLSSSRAALILGASLAFGAVVTGCSDSTSTDPTPVVVTPPQPRTDPPPPPGPPAPTVGLEHIYIADADGSTPRRVVEGSSPAWSPDGERLAFYRGGNIYVINADGTNETRLTNGELGSWSPDGKKIVFANGDGINIMNSDGSGVTLLLRHDFRDDTYRPWDMGPDKPVWSPDGKRIAFEHLGDGDTQPAQVFVMNVDGSNLHRASIHSNVVYAESDPAWSPDGKRLVYWSYMLGLVVTDANGGTPQVVYSDFPAVAYGSKPVWSPTVERIAFNRNRYGQGMKEIWVLNLGASLATAFLRDAFDLAYSPDGMHIAFVSTRGD